MTSRHPSHPRTAHGLGLSQISVSAVRHERNTHPDTVQAVHSLWPSLCFRFLYLWKVEVEDFNVNREVEMST